MISRFREYRARINKRLEASFGSVNMPWSETTQVTNANPLGINQYTAMANDAAYLSEVAHGRNTLNSHRTAESAHRIAADYAKRLGMVGAATLHEAKAKEHDQAASEIGKVHPVETGKMHGVNDYSGGPVKKWVLQLLYGKGKS